MSRVPAIEKALVPSRANAARPQSSGGWAYEELRRQILENEMAPGFRLTEQEVADRLKVSRTPAREALLKLEAEGLVELKPRQGMRVRHISVDDVREIYELITGLETHAARLAAMRRPAPPEVPLLGEAVEAMERALADEDLHAWGKAEDEYFQLLGRASRNKRLVSNLQFYYQHIQRLRAIVLPLWHKSSLSVVELREVVAGIRDGDEEGAARAQRVHRMKNSIMMVWLLSTHGLCQFDDASLD